MAARRNNGVGGYTLAEILVVMVILSIAAAMVIPNIVSTSDLQAVGAARIISSDLQYAQSVAITTQQPVTVAFDPTNKTYTLRNASGVLIHPMNKTAYVVQFGSQGGYNRLNIVSAVFGSGGSQVVFDEMGSAQNAGAVLIQAGSHQYRITVAAATGKVTVVKVS